MSRPTGGPTPEIFGLAEVDVPDPAHGEVQVRNLYMSLDPAIQGRLYAGNSYVPAFEVGAPLEARAVGEVIASNSPALKEGDLVLSSFGWREVFNAPAERVEKLDTLGLPPQAFLGIAGMTGLTAYVGLTRIAEVQASETVFISAASGAVGSAACQLAKARGCRVIGSAGSPAKVAFLEELGVDATIDYKAVPSLSKALAEAAPSGLDVYFDNVGGSHLEAAIARAKPFARFAICGMISAYNPSQPATGPRNLMLIPGKRLKLLGFLVGDHADLTKPFLDEIVGLHREGRLNMRETVFEGVERAPEAFLGLFTGANTGKMLVKLS